MAPAHSLHDLLAGLAGRGAGQLAAALRDGGHPDLPDEALAEAIVSYADTATIEVAEHLAPFVTAHSAVPLGQLPDAGWDLERGLELLATAPLADPPDEPLAVADPPDEPLAVADGADLAAGGLAGVRAADPLGSVDQDPGDLDFGAGGAGLVGAGPAGPDPTNADPALPEPDEPPEPDPATGPGLVDLFPDQPADATDHGDEGGVG